MIKNICWLSAIVGLAGLWVTFSWAQNAPTGQEESSAGAPNSPIGTTTMPPLSGVQVLAPTFWGTSENYWLPALACAEYATTNPNGLNRNTGLFAETSCAGQMTLQRVHRNNQLNLEFTGAGFFDNRPFESGTPGITKQYGPAANLAIVEQVNGRKWNLMLADQGTYLPEGSMGYTEFAGLSTFAGGMGGSSLASAPALNSAFSPNQSIYGGYAERLSNLSLSEFQYSVGPRTILTATGTFGTQQFLTSGYIDQRYWSIMTGYNRTFGRSNEVALAYDEMHYNFGPTQPGFLTRGASILYGRQISSRVFLSNFPWHRWPVRPPFSPSVRPLVSTWGPIIPCGTVPCDGTERSGLTGP